MAVRVPIDKESINLPLKVTPPRYRQEANNVIVDHAGEVTVESRLDCGEGRGGRIIMIKEIKRKKPKSFKNFGVR